MNSNSTDDYGLFPMCEKKKKRAKTRHLHFNSHVQSVFVAQTTIDWTDNMNFDYWRVKMFDSFLHESTTEKTKPKPKKKEEKNSVQIVFFFFIFIRFFCKWNCRVGPNRTARMVLHCEHFELQLHTTVYVGVCTRFFVSNIYTTDKASSIQILSSILSYRILWTLANLFGCCCCCCFCCFIIRSMR